MGKTKGVLGVVWDLCGVLVKRLFAIIICALYICVFTKLCLQIGLYKSFIIVIINIAGIIFYHVVFFLVMCYNVSKLPSTYEEFTSRYNTRTEAILDVTMHRNTVRPRLLCIFMIMALPLTMFVWFLDMATGSKGKIFNALFPTVKECYTSNVRECECYCDKRFKHRVYFKHWSSAYYSEWYKKNGKPTLQDIEDVDDEMLSMMDPEE